MNGRLPSAVRDGHDGHTLPAGNAHRASAVAAAIDEHRRLVLVDEDLFDAAGRTLVTADRLAASEAATDAAWMAMMAAPCFTLADVRAKAGYVLGETIGERDELVRGMTGPADRDTYAPDACLPTFLRSLLRRALDGR